LHVVAYQRQCLVVGAKGPEQRVYGKEPDENKYTDEKKRQRQAVGRNGLDLSMVAMADRTCKNRCRPHPEADRDAADCHDDGKRKTKRRQWDRPEFADKIGVGKIEGDDREHPPGHWYRQSQKRKTHMALGQARPRCNTLATVQKIPLC